VTGQQPAWKAVSGGRLTPAAGAVHAARGVAMGAAEALPGISGGTIALVVGVYQRLVGSVHAAARAVLGLVRARPREARAAAGDIHFDLMIPLLAAMLPTVLVGFAVFGDLLARYEAPFRAVLFGLVLASLWLPWRQIGARKAAHVVVAAGGAVAAFVLTGLPLVAAGEPALWLVALAAAAALSAWILPGVSGSYLLLVLGVYDAMGPAVRSADWAFLGVFAGGGLVGLGAFSTLLSYLLTRHHDMTMALLTGLLLGALRALWPWQGDGGALLRPEMAELVLLLPLFAAGLAGVIALTVLGDRLGRRRPAGETAGR
jgi:putative membrane protein